LLTPSFVILFLSSDDLDSSCMEVVLVVVSVEVDMVVSPADGDSETLQWTLAQILELRG
jgi:hypothetical protein